MYSNYVVAVDKHTHTHIKAQLTGIQLQKSNSRVAVMKMRLWASSIVVQKRKCHCTWEIAIHTPRACLTWSLSSVSPPPSFACLLDVISLFLALPVALLTKSRLLCREQSLWFIPYFHIKTVSCDLRRGERTERERRRTRGLSRSVTTWCGWGELAAAGSVICHHQCQWFIMWLEQLLPCNWGKQIASSCATSTLGNCYCCAVVDALTQDYK